jgi:hypothetical protein
MMNGRVDEELQVGATVWVLQEVWEWFVKNPYLLQILFQDKENRMEVSEGIFDEGFVYTEYSCNLHSQQGIDRQDHCTQNPPQVPEHSGVLGIRKRVH